MLQKAYYKKELKGLQKIFYPDPTPVCFGQFLDLGMVTRPTATPELLLSLHQGSMHGLLLHGSRLKIDVCATQ